MRIKLLLVVWLLTCGLGFGQTTTINFDNNSNWSAGSGILTSFQTNHIYTDGDMSFTGGPALRQGNALQDGFPSALGTYSWRLRDAAGVDWRGTLNKIATIEEFGFLFRRWDANPAINYSVSYSINSGATWNVVGSLSASSSDWQAYSHILTSAITVNSGEFIVRVERIGGERIMIDDFFYVEGSACTPPTDPTGMIDGVLPFCDDTTLTFSGAAPVGNIDYWQSSPTGTSTSNDASTPLLVTTSGSYYVRRFNTATSCWSAGALGPYNVNLETQATIDTQPVDVTSPVNGSAVFTVSSSNATTYQWQEQIGAGAWTNIDSNTNTLTLSSLSLTQNGNRYRVLVSNLCGGFISNVVVLTVIDVCGSESFTNSNATGSYTDGNFVGDNGVTWSYFASRDENGDANGSGIDGAALMLRRASDNSRVISSVVPGGIQDFSVKLYKGFTGGGNRQVELFVNGISQGTSTPFDNFNEQIFTVSNINITGNVVVEIRNITGNQVIIDDIQ